MICIKVKTNKAMQATAACCNELKDCQAFIDNDIVITKAEDDEFSIIIGASDAVKEGDIFLSPNDKIIYIEAKTISF